MTQESRAVLLVTDTNRDTGQESWKWHGIAVFMWRKGWMPSRMPRERLIYVSFLTINSCSLIFYSKEREHFLNSFLSISNEKAKSY